MRRPLLLVDGLQVRYPSRRWGWRRSLLAVDDVSFEILPGETLGLVGQSGSGKTTTGLAVLGLVRPSAGRIALDGVELRGLRGAALRRARRRMQVVFQDPGTSLDPRMTVEDLVAEPLLATEIGASLRLRVHAMLERCGLDPREASRLPGEFSAGQQQRIAIARALVTEPSLVVCDEPVSSLDVSVQAQLLTLLRELARERGISYLFISHDLATVRQIADRIAVMYAGRIVEVGPADAICSWPLHPFTQALLRAVPRVDPPPSLSPPLPGDAPSPENPPPGCAFHPRCPLARPGLCDVRVPQLRRVSLAQRVACHLVEEQG